jgi:hypothetical protein
MTQSKPYLVRVRHTDNPKRLMATIWAEEKGIIDFFSIRVPEDCFTNESEPRLTDQGIKFLKLVDPECMNSTRLYIPGTVRMSYHRAKDLPELAEYRQWLFQYLRGYQSNI